MGSPRVTFITHEASRTGAPRVLLTLMRWLRTNTDIRIATLAARPGPLLPAFAELGPLVVLDGDWRHFNIIQRGIRLTRQVTAESHRGFDSFLHRAAGTSLWMAKLRQLRRLGDCDLIYANSVQSGWGVRSLLSHAPLVSHLHELGDALLDPWEQRNVATMCGRAETIIVPAIAVRELLVDHLGVPASRISVQYPFIDVQAHQSLPETRAAVRRELEIPDDAVVVGMSGGFTVRKGADCFVGIATKVLRRAPSANVYFLWVGGSAENEYGRYMIGDIERTGLAPRWRFVPEVVDPRRYLAGVDVLMLSSRSDPFPLVCLETAVLAQAPVVCFAGAGGMPELVGDDCGFVVPYLDDDAAAGAVLHLVADPGLRHRLGANAAERVRSRHDVAKAAPALAAIICSALGSDTPLRVTPRHPRADEQPRAAPNVLQQRGQPNGAASLVHTK